MPNDRPGFMGPMEAAARITIGERPDYVPEAIYIGLVRNLVETMLASQDTMANYAPGGSLASSGKRR